MTRMPLLVFAAVLGFWGQRRRTNRGTQGWCQAAEAGKAGGTNGLQAGRNGEGEMTGTPRSRWTTEQDKELQALIFSASRVETIAQALHRTPSAVRRRASILRLPMKKIARRRSRFDPPGL